MGTLIDEQNKPLIEEVQRLRDAISELRNAIYFEEFTVFCGSNVQRQKIIDHTQCWIDRIHNPDFNATNSVDLYVGNDNVYSKSLAPGDTDVLKMRFHSAPFILTGVGPVTVTGRIKR